MEIKEKERKFIEAYKMELRLNLISSVLTILKSHGWVYDEKLEETIKQKMRQLIRGKRHEQQNRKNTKRS